MIPHQRNTARDGLHCCQESVEIVGTQARLPSVRRLIRPLTLPWVPRLIATLGILAMVLGLYKPIAGRDVVVVPIASGGEIAHDGPATHIAETWAISKTMLYAALTVFHGRRVPLRVELGTIAVISALALGGLGLIPLLWRPLSPKVTALLRRSFATWLFVLAIFAMVAGTRWWHVMAQPPLKPGFQTIVASEYLLPAAALFPLGVLLNAGAVALLFNEPLPAYSPTPAHRTGWQLAAALALTVGALMWGIGFYLMPAVVTTGCPSVIFAVTHFELRTCAGLDSDQVQVPAYYAGLNGVALFFHAVGRHFDFLVGAGCITALGGWTRRLTVATLAWLAAWPVLALGVALIALQGAGIIVRHGYWLTAGPDWRVGPGMYATFAGLGLVALGQCGLWLEMARQHTKKRALAVAPR
jgi:hypothetical protein